MDERQTRWDDDERLVTETLRRAFPHERPVFSRRRGEQIIRAAAIEHAGRRHPRRGSRVAACLAATVTLMVGTTGVAGAALPGQPLYRLKHLVERAMIAVTTDDVDAARLELRFAERRLREADVVDDTVDPGVTDSLAERFNEHVNAATSLAGDSVADEVDRLRDVRGSDALTAPDVYEGQTTSETNDPSTAVVPSSSPPTASADPADPSVAAPPSPDPSSPPPAAVPSELASPPASVAPPAVAPPDDASNAGASNAGAADAPSETPSDAASGPAAAVPAHDPAHAGSGPPAPAVAPSDGTGPRAAPAPGITSLPRNDGASPSSRR